MFIIVILSFLIYPFIIRCSFFISYYSISFKFILLDIIIAFLAFIHLSCLAYKEKNDSCTRTTQPSLSQLLLGAMPKPVLGGGRFWSQKGGDNKSVSESAGQT